MLHLNRFQQHQMFIGEACDERCLVCPIHEKKEVPPHGRSGDIINIYGAPTEIEWLDAIKMANKRRWITRGWVTHRLDGVTKNVARMMDELVIWCPAPDQRNFNEICGEDYFDAYIHNVHQLDCKKTLSILVQQSNLDEIPTFYDWVIDTNADGMLLYYPNEFNKEERAYIKRFHRVPGIQLIPIINAPTHMSLGMPNTIGTARFEWNDWWYQMRQSIRSLPIIKYTV